MVGIHLEVDGRTLFLSLCFVCINTEGGTAWRGWEALLWGWLGATGLATEPTSFAWFANPLLVLTLLFFRSQRFGLALIVGIPSLLLALSSFQLQGMAALDESGAMTNLFFGLGFYLWLVCFIIPVVMSTLFYRLRKARQREEALEELDE